MGWNAERPAPGRVRDAHSLYLEVLAELGLVGAVLLATALLTIFIGFFKRLNGAARGPVAALMAAGVTWLIEAGFDWIWEMPAVTAWLFFAGGVVLARPLQPVSTQRWPPLLIRVPAVVAITLLCLTPARVALSQARLDESQAAFDDGRCTETIDSALSSLSAFGDQPQAYALLGYCDARLGDRELGVKMMARATEQDPGNWVYHYGLALLQGEAGLDPRDAAREARTLSPTEAEAINADRLLFGRGDNPEQWRRAAERLPLPVN